MDLFIEMKAKTGRFQELDFALTALMPALQNKKKGKARIRVYWDVDELRRYMHSDHGCAIVESVNLLRKKSGAESIRKIAGKDLKPSNNRAPLSA